VGSQRRPQSLLSVGHVAAQCLREARIFRRDHSALTGREVLYRMKTKNSHVGDAAYLAPMTFSAERVAGIFDDGQSVPLGKFQKGIEVRGMTGVVNR